MLMISRAGRVPPVPMDIGSAHRAAVPLNRAFADTMGQGALWQVPPQLGEVPGLATLRTVATAAERDPSASPGSSATDHSKALDHLMSPCA
jgi:hypothetical protein